MRRLIIFGVLKGYIARVHRYPIGDGLGDLLDGTRHCDHLFTLFGVSAKELDGMLDKLGGIKYIHS